MAALNGKTICQVSLVVTNIEETARHYAALFGIPVPPITICPPEEIAHTQFEGKATPTRAKLCNFDLGQVVLELTEADEYPSTWKDFIEQHGAGVHHIGFVTENREETIRYFEEQNMPVRHYGEYPGGNYTIMDSAEKLGVYVNVKYQPAKK